jgi:hypothetical protein
MNQSCVLLQATAQGLRRRVAAEGRGEEGQRASAEGELGVGVGEREAGKFLYHGRCVGYRSRAECGSRRFTVGGGAEQREWRRRTGPTAAFDNGGAGAS